ncbi:MAG: response regulator [Bradyrhizobium sp.]|uniref:response regulator transcription factor n=1 Tax=Bradyrhizobium sp. TaxID=376 RepID=UPI0029BFA73C|nr:response regulator [Bradyrhizobium sp.]MDX3968607.1 response regulator [Bradyrhizobium sp.]
MRGSHQSRIAIVDDDVRILESLQNLLESAGHSVCSFSSAQSLLEDSVLPEIDCLIADIGMPLINGFELHRLARDARPDLPIIFITARPEAATQKRAAAQGHQGFFRKPFDGPALLAAVKHALSASSQGK